MRSLSIASMILLAFVLGLTLGGQVPREAVAQDDQGGIEWKKVGDNMVFTNWTEDGAYVVLTAYRDGAIAPAPPLRANGILKVPTVALDRAYVYRLEPELACDPIECYICDPRPGGEPCPTPPRPPLDSEYDPSVLGSMQ